MTETKVIFNAGHIEAIKRSKATDCTLDVPRPEGLNFRPYQKAGVYYHLLNSSKRTLIADPPGLGKTIQAIGVANFSRLQKIVVIAPASLLLNWEREFRTWSTEDLTYFIFRPKKGKKVPTIEPANVYFISYNGVIDKEKLKFLIDFKPDLLILDEVHKLKNLTTQRTLAVFGKGGNKGLVGASGEVVALSGTPFSNRPLELYSIIRSMNFKTIDYMAKLDYAVRYCGAFFGPYGLESGPATNTKELGFRLRANFMVRRNKMDVLKDLPDLSTSLAFLEANPEANRVMARMAEFTLDELTNADKSYVTYEGVSKCRKDLGISKVPSCVEYIREQLEAGEEKIILFAHHRDVIFEAEKALAEFGVVKLMGGMSLEEKQKSVDLFQNDPTKKIFLGSITAAGEGITLTASSLVLFLETSFVPGENVQCIDRAHRIGQKNDVRAVFLAFANSLDERILSVHLEKLKEIKSILFN